MLAGPVTLDTSVTHRAAYVCPWSYKPCGEAIKVRDGFRQRFGLVGLKIAGIYNTSVVFCVRAMRENSGVLGALVCRDVEYIYILMYV